MMWREFVSRNAMAKSGPYGCFHITPTVRILADRVPIVTVKLVDFLHSEHSSASQRSILSELFAKSSSHPFQNVSNALFLDNLVVKTVRIGIADLFESFRVSVSNKVLIFETS